MNRAANVSLLSDLPKGEPIPESEHDNALEAEQDEPGPGIYLELGKLPPATPLDESGLAKLMGKRCRESIKRAVARGELPPSTKVMGKNLWTAGVIIRHLEERLKKEANKVTRMHPHA